MMSFGRVILCYVGGLVILSVVFITLPLVITSQDELVLQHEYTYDGNATLYLLDGETGIRTAFDQIDSQTGGSEAGWSPNGRFVHILDHHVNDLRILRLFDTATGHLQILTEDLYSWFCMVPLWWSPDGRLLAFIEGKYEGTNIARLWDTYNNSIIRLGQIQFDNYHNYIAWSPDSRYVVVFNVGNSADSRAYSMLIYDTLNGQVIEHSVTGAVVNFYWSVDGRFLAFSTYRESENIYLYDTLLQTLIDVSLDTKTETFLGWSPISNQLLFEIHTTWEIESLLLFDAEQGISRIVGEKDVKNGRASWSPDGEHITAYFEQTDMAQFTIWSVDNGTPIYTSQYKLPLKGFNFIWSADGRYGHMFISTENERSDNIVNLIDGNVSKIDTDQQLFEPISWSPEGHYLAGLLSNEKSKLEGYTLVLVNPTDGSLRHVSDNVPPLSYYDAYKIKWNADGSLLSFTNDEGWVIYDVTRNRIHSMGEGYLRWHGNGRYFSFDSAVTSKEQLYIVVNGELGHADPGLERVYLAHGVRRSEGKGLGLNTCR